MVNSAIYRPRSPRASALWQCLWNHYSDFLHNYPRNQERKYGYLRDVVEEVLEKFLECGDLSRGFARIRCPDCSHEMLLSFSCKARYTQQAIYSLYT